MLKDDYVRLSPYMRNWEDAESLVQLLSRHQQQTPGQHRLRLDAPGHEASHLPVAP